jgi:succinoglycan biosynthesis transport protein ExoP
LSDYDASPGTRLGPRSQGAGRALSAVPVRPAVDGDDIQLADLLQVLRRRKRLALSTFIATLLLGALLTAWQRAYSPVFQGSFKLLVSDPINSEDRQGAPDAGGALENLALQGSGGSANTSTLIQVLTSPLLLSPIEQSLGLEEGELGPITISTPKATGKGGNDGVLEVTLQWPDPVQGREILQKLSAEYLAYSLRQRQEKLTQGLAFLDQQAPELQARVVALQNRLATFRQSSGFVEPAEQAQAIKQQQLELSNSRKDLEQKQARLEGLAAAVRRGHLNSAPFQGSNSILQGPTTSKGLEGGVVSSAFTNLLQDLTQVEKQLAEAEATYTDEAPQVRELRSKRDRLRPLLQRRELDAIQASLSENRSQLGEILRQQEQLARRFQVNPVQMKEYEALQQQLVVARDNLTSYIKARESFRLQVAQRTVPWSVLAPPRFKASPVIPSVPRNLLLSLVLGGLAGVGVALLRDRLDHVFHNPKELREALAMPLLGVVPYLRGGEGNTISQTLATLDGGERFAIKESLRNLFANFRLLRADKPVRLVAFTSSTQGEGKSTTSALFAQTLAQLGQRVLLVDADMRRPMVHRLMGVTNVQGLSSLLTDARLAIEGVVQTLQPGLDLLTAGPVPPDPTQLLSSERCGLVVEAIRQLPGYDLVIFDTPPALLLSDPVLLSDHLDGLIFLVGLSRVNRDLPAQALQRVRDTGVDVLGVLANQPVRSGSVARGYGYGYGDYAAAKLPEPEQVAAGEGLEPVGISPRLPKKPSRRLSLRTRSRQLIHWLDERE